MKGDYFKTEEGARLFSALAEADPKSALETLKKTVGEWSKEELLKFATGRREVIWALEKIAMWKDLFADAARLLLVLGEAENETWSNNASGIFAQLFSPGIGKVAPTEASPQERFPILKEALESSSKERRMLALHACGVALETQHFSRMVGAEYQGLRKPPQQWTPKTYGELFDAYRQVWQFLREKLDMLPEEERKEAINIILNHARGVGRIQNLAPMVIDTLNELTKKPYADKKEMLKMVISFLHYHSKDLPVEIRQLWEELRDRLTGSGYHSLMRRYVCMDVFEDKFDEKGQQVDQAQPRIEELAEESVKNVAMLKEELSWLVTAEAENGYRFGYELGKRDKDFSLLPMLLNAQRNAFENASVYFLGGYFRAVFEKSPEREWEKQLDALAEDEKLNVWVPELSWRSGISDRAALRILSLAEKGIIDINKFRMFGYGRAAACLSEKVVHIWIRFLLKNNTYNAVSIALDLYYFYYIQNIQKDSKHNLPEELTLELLIHPLFFKKTEEKKRDQMDEHNWTELGKAFVRLYPTKSLSLADKMLEHFGEDGTIFDGFHSPVQSVLDEIARQHPKEMWTKLTKYLGPPQDVRAFHISEWLKGSSYFDIATEGILPLFPVEEIWKWVDADVENRAKYISHFVPKALFRQEGKICLAREVLVRYGSRKDVRAGLIANFSTEGWSGPESLHYETKKQQLLDFRKGETNENVLRWINEYVTSLDWQIERAKIEEERRGY